MNDTVVQVVMNHMMSLILAEKIAATEKDLIFGKDWVFL